jgi:dienelactone hydrolase
MTRATVPAAPIRCSRASRALVGAFALAAATAATAGEPGGGDAYLASIRVRAAALRAGDAPPSSLAEWAGRRPEVRRRLAAALGPVPDPPPPLDPARYGTLERDGYRVEKVTFQTLPGVRMTANLYLPASPGRHPAILAVHGHWRGAKQDPVVQARCIGAAKLGFAVLAVDALGAGERAIGKALGEYHGEMTAATLLPTGQTLAGLQVYENTRALAYLATRPEVDSARVGVSGASGGGNQTMYAAAMIDGLRAAVPVCSVGNYRSYLGAACCLCEVVPGALTFAEEWGVLALAAPKPLMVINATKDAVQFSVPEARTTIAGLEPLYRLFGAPQDLRHSVVESGHDYNKAMREAAYGWFALHLAGRGDGSPIAEPAIRTENPEALRCFPGDTRPDDFVTLPRYAAAEGGRMLGAKAVPSDLAAWKAEAERRRAALVAVLGGFPDGPPRSPQVDADGRIRVVRFEPEPGLRLAARVEPAREADAPRVILIDLDGGGAASASPLAAALRQDGRSLVTIDLRATGRLAVPSDSVGHTPDHNSAEWGLWVGRPLMGQWACDIRRLLDALDALDARGGVRARDGAGRGRPRRPGGPRRGGDRPQGLARRSGRGARQLRLGRALSGPAPRRHRPGRAPRRRRRPAARGPRCPAEGGHRRRGRRRRPAPRRWPDPRRVRTRGAGLPRTRGRRRAQGPGHARRRGGRREGALVRLRASGGAHRLVTTRGPISAGFPGSVRAEHCPRVRDDVLQPASRTVVIVHAPDQRLPLLGPHVPIHKHVTSGRCERLDGSHQLQEIAQKIRMDLGFHRTSSTTRMSLPDRRTGRPKAVPRGWPVVR